MCGSSIGKAGDALANVDVEVVEGACRHVEDDLAWHRPSDRPRPPAAGRPGLRTRERRPPSPPSSSLVRSELVFMSDIGDSVNLDARARRPPARSCSPRATTSTSCGRRSRPEPTSSWSTSRTPCPSSRRARRARSCVSVLAGDALRRARRDPRERRAHARSSPRTSSSRTSFGRTCSCCRRRRRRPSTRSARTGPPVVAIVETADGLRHAYEVASLPRVQALIVGAVDLGVELRLEQRDDGLEILFARSKAVPRLGGCADSGSDRPGVDRRAGRRRARGRRASSHGRWASAAKPASTRIRSRS